MARMRLRYLDARFVGAGGEGVTNADGSPVPARHGVGLSFKCPCGKDHHEYDRVFVEFENPIDGGPRHSARGPAWHRTGDTIDTITLSPSILRQEPGGCGWHGSVTNGEAHE